MEAENIDSIKALGFNSKMSSLVDPADFHEFLLARVVMEHRERYTIHSPEGVLHAEITGNLRYSAENRLDFPAVGDWVKCLKTDEHTAIILEVMPRFSILQRQAVGQYGERQIIATNIDTAFIVQATGHDFNLNRLERYLIICHGASIEPVILLTKTDLIMEVELVGLVTRIKHRMPSVPVIPVSNVSRQGYDQVREKMMPYSTCCFIGSSGVGKSSLVNGLAGEEVLKTRQISESTSKGKHTTSHRELIILPNKCLIIDTPGMRELGMTDQEEGLETTYQEIQELAENCRFKDCSHISEAGCAVLEALENGELDAEVYENFMKLRREQERFTSTIYERREKDRKQGKLYKSIIQAKKKSR